MKTNEQYLQEIYEKYEIEKKKKKSPSLLKMCAAFVSFAMVVAGVAYAAITIKNYTNNAKLNPSFTGTLGNANENKVWVGTFNLVWNELMEQLGGDVEFVSEENELAEELNQRSFSKDYLSPNSYYLETGIINPELKQTIEKVLKERFQTDSQILDRIDWNTKDKEYLIYAMLNKEFTFEVPFPKQASRSFAGSTEKVKYFGLEYSSIEETFEQVTALFYHSEEDFAVKIATKEGEELILYRNNHIQNFDEAYEEVKQKTQNYTGRRELVREKDEMKIPFIKINAEINYDELCNKVIKGTNGAYIKQAVQQVDFYLDNYGGNIKSEAMINMYMCVGPEDMRKFNFTDQFVIFLKEEGKEKPYFAALIDNTDVLVTDETESIPDEYTKNVTINIIP